MSQGDGLEINQCLPNIPYSTGARIIKERTIGINEYKIIDKLSLNLVFVILLKIIDNILVYRSMDTV